MDDNRFYSLDIHTQYILQDSVRRDSFKNITTIEGVQWLLFTFYHWGIQYLTYDDTKGLQLFHSKPVYDTKSKSWYGGVITKSVEDIDSSSSGNNGESTNHVEDNGVGESNGNTTIADDKVGVNHVTRDSNVTGASDSVVNWGILNQGEPNRTDSMGISNHSGVRYTVPVRDYVDTINTSKNLSFYIHSLISSVFPFKDGTGIELVTQAINEDATKQKLHDGSIVEVSNNGVTWFKRYFKEIVPNMSTKFCVYGGGRTKDTIRDMADVEYYQYIRYNDTDTVASGNTCGNTCGNTGSNTCSNCNTVKYEGTRNTVDGRVVFSDRDSFK